MNRLSKWFARLSGIEHTTRNLFLAGSAILLVALAVGMCATAIKWGMYKLLEDSIGLPLTFAIFWWPISMVVITTSIAFVVLSIVHEAFWKVGIAGFLVAGLYYLLLVWWAFKYW